jgi:hypothetical protein
MQPDTILVCILAAVLTAIVTWYLTRKFMARHYETVKSLDFEVKRNSLVDETREAVVASADFTIRLENEYRRGREDGQKAELEKFSIVYEPYQETKEEYMGLKKRAEIGYSMQLHYSGLPIGQSTLKITHTNVEFDAAKIDKIMSSELMSTLNSLCQLLVSKGMSGKVLPRKVI